MYKSKRSQPAYHSKENFVLYNFNVTLLSCLINGCKVLVV